MLRWGWRVPSYAHSLSLSLSLSISWFSRIDVAGHMHGETIARDLAIFPTDSHVAGVRSLLLPVERCNVGPPSIVGKSWVMAGICYREKERGERGIWEECEREREREKKKDQRKKTKERKIWVTVFLRFLSTAKTTAKRWRRVSYSRCVLCTMIRSSTRITVMVPSWCAL